MSNICRNPVRIWRNGYQSLFSVREKWFWACVKWAPPALAAASQEAAKPVLVLLQALSSSAPCCKWCAPVQGPVWPQTSHQHCCGLLLLWWYWWNATLSSGLWLPGCDSPVLWFVMQCQVIKSFNIIAGLHLLLGGRGVWLGSFLLLYAE